MVYTRAMMYDMYTLIYGLFEQWGSCCKIGCSKWQDTYGNEVPKDKALGHRVKLKLLHLDLILSMDEQGDTGTFKNCNFATTEINFLVIDRKISFEKRFKSLFNKI